MPPVPRYALRLLNSQLDSRLALIAAVRRLRGVPLTEARDLVDGPKPANLWVFSNPAEASRASVPFAELAAADVQEVHPPFEIWLQSFRRERLNQVVLAIRAVAQFGLPEARVFVTRAMPALLATGASPLQVQAAEWQFRHLGSLEIRVPAGP